MLNNTGSLSLKLTGKKTIIVCVLILNILSLLSIYSSLHKEGLFIGQETFFRQLIWIIISWIFLLLFSFINYRNYYQAAYFIYGANIILLIAVHLFGNEAMGAQRWLTIFGLNFQPSELSKIAIIIILARIFSSKQRNAGFYSLILPLSLVFLNALIIFKQPDLGTALILIFLLFTVGVFSKIKRRYFVSLILVGLIACPFIFSSLKTYQKERLMVFIDPNVDPLGAGYTIIQSKIAIGSGKILGKGFLAGTQNQFNFLPERHTDFIFTVIAEEWGIVGTIFLLLIYWLILKKILQKTKQVKDLFAYFLLLGISMLFFMHIFINIGMTLGILPVVGLPLIFLSYGGTNLVTNFMLLGIFFNICRSKN